VRLGHQGARLGKSFRLKRLCWDTIARGGQVVTIDRTAIGEYARFTAVLARPHRLGRAGSHALAAITSSR